MARLVLASASPRRRELLGRIAAEFDVAPADLDEEALTVADPVATARALALAKARAVAGTRPGDLVIGSDTVVWLAGIGQLAKPADAADARRMLFLLSGRTHTVTTGVALVGPGGEDVFHESADVTFRALGEEEIAAYVAGGEPMDKAGAYGLQGAGGGFVAGVAGDRDAVVGLPVAALARALAGRSEVTS